MIKKIITLLLLTTSPSIAEEIILEWDSPKSPVDGIRIFQRTAYPDDTYDFERPVAEVGPNETSVRIDVPGEPDKVLKYLWVARAFIADFESDNSNEVDYKVVNTIPPQPVELTGYYDSNNSIVYLSWKQPEDTHPVWYWKVFYRVDSVGFIELGQVNKDAELELISSFDVVPDGEFKEVDFVVVAFRRSGVFSENSETLNIRVDRRDQIIVPPVDNLRIEIEIPVQ